MAHRYADYWNCAPGHVPAMTGAAALLDGRDLVGLCEHFGIQLPLYSVLDIGCGTGRVAQHCSGYHGADISKAMVDYCRERGISAAVIEGADDLPDTRDYAWILAMSVFTHVGRDERLAYLSRFQAPSLLVDIIPGNGGGDVAKWTAVRGRFEQDLVAAGYNILDSWEMNWAPETSTDAHRYYYAEHA